MSELIYTRAESNLHLKSNIERCAYPIWHDLFSVRVAYQDTFNDNEIKHFGMPSEGDEQFDRQAHHDYLETMFTVNAMVEYFTVGKTVVLKHPPDSLVIFNMIEKYLYCWKSEIEESINLHRAPIEDLINLSRFAERCHYLAVQFMPQKAVAPIFGFSAALSRQGLEELAGFGQVDTPENQVPVYHSLENYFSGIKVR